MRLNEFIDSHLNEADDFYESLPSSDKEEYLNDYKNTLYGTRLIVEYYIEKYIRSWSK